MSLEDHGRAGPKFHGNYIRANTINGVLIDVNTEVSGSFDKLNVAARLSSTEVTYVLQEKEFILLRIDNHLTTSPTEHRVIH